MKVHIDGSACHGHGRCVVICPEVFEFDDDGHGIVRVVEPDDAVQPAVRRAAANCPEQAITVSQS